MSELLRSLATTAQAVASGGLSSYEDAAKRGRQQYNREQSRRSAGRYREKETPEEYNKRKAREMLGMGPEHEMDRFSRGPSGAT